jgi:alpha-tubulin suppressor-like RCC1 family protein
MHDRTAVCWGVDTFGQVISVPSDELTSISAGAYHVCGIKAVDNTVVCWGKNIDGQLDETVGGTIAAGTS